MIFLLSRQLRPRPFRAHPVIWRVHLLYLGLLLWVVPFITHSPMDWQCLRNARSDVNVNHTLNEECCCQAVAVGRRTIVFGSFERSIDSIPLLSGDIECGGESFVLDLIF